MLAIEDWGQGRFTPMVMLAQLVATSAQNCYEVILDSRELPWLVEGNQALFAKPEALQTLYHRPLQLEATVLQMLSEPLGLNHLDDTGQEWRTIRQSLNGTFAEVIRDSLTGGASAKDIDRANCYVRRFYRWVHLRMMRRRLKDQTELPANVREWVSHPAFVFFMKIAMPCWLEYHLTPWELFQKARQGNFEALEQLGRLDPNIENDDCLRRHIARLQVTNPSQYRQFHIARCEGRRKPITLKDVKFQLGGLLMKWSKEWQYVLDGELHFSIMKQLVRDECRATLLKWIKVQREQIQRGKVRCWLKGPDIKRLFDAIAKDNGDGLVDPDFNQQPNAIYKRLDRNAKLWRSLLETDKRRAA